jgi:dihydrofolate reductase
MPNPFRYEGYVIASADGMIAGADGRMPEALINRADQRYLSDALDRAAVLVHGRHSHESGGDSQRRRVIVTGRTATFAADPDTPHAVLWNPLGAPFAAACAALGVEGGVAAVLGGPQVYALFLTRGYAAFHLSRSTKVSAPDGVPVFGRDARPVDEALAAAGLKPDPPRWLDERAGVSVTTWRPPAAA